MNMRNRMARYASRASSDYHTYQFFKDRNATEKAIITSLSEDYLSVMLIKYGLESRLEFNEQEKEQVKELNKSKKFIKEAVIQGKQVALFDYLNVEVKVELHGFSKKMILKVL
jgi:exosome complex exonuclease DIS3/RRP44